MSDNTAWGVGVCVTLKSGSPKMVICGAPSKGWNLSDKADAVSTVWFDGGECRTGDFLIACLNLAPE